MTLSFVPGLMDQWRSQFPLRAHGCRLLNQLGQYLGTHGHQNRGKKMVIQHCRLFQGSWRVYMIYCTYVDITYSLYGMTHSYPLYNGFRAFRWQNWLKEPICCRRWTKCSHAFLCFALHFLFFGATLFWLTYFIWLLTEEQREQKRMNRFCFVSLENRSQVVLYIWDDGFDMLAMIMVIVELIEICF